MLHAGDSYFFHGQIETPMIHAPFMLGAFQRMADTDRAARVANQERFRRLKAGARSISSTATIRSITRAVAIGIEGSVRPLRDADAL
jgi:hypothetical protein